MTEPTRVLCRARHRIGGLAPRHNYRSRTGPKCCNAGCGSTRKKSKRAVKKEMGK